MGEMVQADERAHAAPMKVLEHHAIAREGCPVPLPLLRFEPAPLDGKPQRRQSHSAGQVEVAFGIAPPVTSQTTAIAGLDPACSFPRGPLIVVIVALDL